MKRRNAMTLLAGAVASPLVARAQLPGRMRRIGILMSLPAEDLESIARIAALIQGLGELGWTVGRNLRIDARWSADTATERKNVAELVALAPEVIVANGSSIVDPLLQATRIVPVVFVNVVDPLGAGFVDSLARPGGNATGFSLFEYGIGSKWVELLKAIAPGMTRAAVIRDPSVASGSGQLGAIQSAGQQFGVDVSPIDVRDAGEMERRILAFAGTSNGGLIVPAGGLAIAQRGLIIALAARHKLPAIYPFRYFATGGGLISYGPDQVDPYRRAAGYVDRILKGEKPAELPVQAPTRYELVINLNTAKAQGLTVSPTLLAAADEVIE